MAFVVAAVPIAATSATAAAPTIGATVASFLATTALSMTLSYAAGALQPKASTSGGETGGRMVQVSNTGTDPRIVILGKFRDAGTLVWHKEHDRKKVKVTQVIQLCDLPITSFVNEIVDGGIVPLVPNESQTVRGHEPGGTGFNFGDDPVPDSLDWVPVVPSGTGHGDVWRKTGAPAAIYVLRATRWEVVPGVFFHDLPASNPTAGLGANGDFAINRTSGEVFVKRAGFWRSRAFTSATAPAGKHEFFEASVAPTDHSRFLHWEDGDRRWRWHFKVRYYDGTQLAADSFLMAIADPSSEWDSSFKGLGRAYKVVTQRYYPDIYTGAFPVQTATIMLGIKVYDPRRAATGTNVDWYGTTVKSDQIAWTENAALLTAFIKCWPELPGAVPYAQIDEPELIASANVCDQTITNPDGTTEPRYTVNGMVQSTETRDSVEEALEIALGGHIFRRNGKWVIWAGRARATTATFSKQHIVGTDYDYQPGPGLRERKNTVLGTWFAPTHNYTQVSIKQYQNSTFLAEDKGQELRESIHFRFASRSRFTPRRQAKIWLFQRRNEANVLTVDLDYEALDLSPLDVIEITEDFVGLAASRFTVAALDSPFLSPVGDTGGSKRVSCILIAYNPNTWDAPSDNPTEEDPELPGVRDLSTVDPPASISVAAVTSHPAVDVDGKLLASVRLEIGRSPDLYAHEYEIQYRMSPENFIAPFNADWGDGSAYLEEQEWTSVSKIPHARKDPFAVRIKSLFDFAFYDFRAAAHNLAGASSDAYEDDDWTRQIDAYRIISGRIQLPGPPGSGVTGSNEVVDGNFEDGPGANTWDLVDEAGTLPSASATIVTTGGKYGPHMLQIAGSATAAGQVYRVRSRNLISVTAGEWRQIKVAFKKSTAGVDTKVRLIALFFNASGGFVSAWDLIDQVISNTVFPESRSLGEVQVPGAGNIATLQIEAKVESTAAGLCATHWDGFSCRELIKMSTDRGDILVERKDTTFVNLRSLNGFTTGDDETSVYFDGDEIILFSAAVEAEVKRDGATDITSSTRAVARLRLEQVGVGTTSIVTLTRIAVLRPGEVASGGSSDPDMKNLSEYVRPAQGNYRVHLEGAGRGDLTNGTAQFLRYWIRVSR